MSSATRVPSPMSPRLRGLTVLWQIRNRKVAEIGTGIGVTGMRFIARSFCRPFAAAGVVRPNELSPATTRATT
jgi:hypothetical protein